MTDTRTTLLLKCITASFCMPLLLLLLASCSSQGGTDTGNPNGTSEPLAIVSVAPTEVKAGAEITITGTGFGNSQGDSVVTISGSTAVATTLWSATKIKAIVPQDAVTGAVKVTVQGVSSSEVRLLILWDNSNPQNVGIYVGDFYSTEPSSQLITDGSGGAIVVWSDENIYAQRLNSRGGIAWSTDRVALSATGSSQVSPQLISDGSGGAIMVWEDYRNLGVADIYAQRINADGNVLWQSGVVVANAAVGEEKPKIVSDGTGGAVIVWQRYGSTGDYEVHAQRIDENGVTQWNANGVEIFSAPNNLFPLLPDIIEDGSGGAIIVWQGYRDNDYSQVYAQRVNHLGAAQWTNNGEPLSTRNAIWSHLPRPVSDDAGGAIIVWSSWDGNNNTLTDIIAQRINHSGVRQWGVDGKTVVDALAAQGNPQMTADGAGGAIITWADKQLGMTSKDIYGQRISPSGTSLWLASGVPLCTAASDQFVPRITADGMGGAIIAWSDYRNTNGFAPDNTDIFAQRVSGDGVTLWAENGEAVSTVNGIQSSPKIVVDGLFGAIILWEDQRSGIDTELYAQGISLNGNQ